MGDGGATWISDMQLRHIEPNGDIGALEASPYRVTVLENDGETASAMDAWVIKPDEDLQGTFDLGDIQQWANSGTPHGGCDH